MPDKARFNKFSSLRLELVLMAMVLVLVMSGTMGLTISLIYNRALNESRLAEAEAFTRGAALSLALAEDWTTYHFNSIENSAYSSGLRLLLISDARGRILVRKEGAGAREETALRAAWASGLAQSSFDGQRFLVAMPIAHRGQVLGAICLSGEPRELRSAEEAALRWMIGALLVNIMLMGLFLFFYLNRRLVAPIKEIASDLKDLGRNSFEPHPRGEGSREIDELFQALHQAARQLPARRGRLVAPLETIKVTQGRLVASEKMAAGGRLASGLAHELGNPIGALTGFVHLLRRDDLNPEDKKNILDQSAAELRRMDGSLKELLHFSRPSRPQPEAVDISEVAGSALNLARPQKWAAGVAFSVQGPPARSGLWSTAMVCCR